MATNAVPTDAVLILQAEPLKDTARDFAVHPPRKSLLHENRLRLLEPLEDQIHTEEELETSILMFRVSEKEFNEWESKVLAKYGWVSAKDFVNSLHDLQSGLTTIAEVMKTLGCVDPK